MNLYLEALDREMKVEFTLNRSLSPTMVSEYNLKLIDKELLQRKLKEYIELAETISDDEQFKVCCKKN